MDQDQHFLQSTLRERIVEHFFVGELLRELWRRSVFDVELLRSEFDAHGYDLVLARGNLVRHLQLKTGMTERPGKVSVGEPLAQKPSGGVLWIRVTPALALGPYYWFGSRPGVPLPSMNGFEHPLRATHNKDKVRPQRKNHRLVPGDKFQGPKDIHDVMNVLFDLPLP